MNDYVVRRAAVMVALLVLSLGVWLVERGVVEEGSALAQLSGTGACPAEVLCVAFLDVGQGDAIFVDSPTGQQLLIDGGRGSAVLRELGTVMGVLDRTLDYILITHPDADHVGGLIDVYERYDVAATIRTQNEADTEEWQLVAEHIDTENSEVYFARRGQRYELGGGVVLEILFPDIDATRLESNKSSIVAKLTYGTTSFLLTGDSPKSIEEYLVLTDGEYLESDVLKVGHHGSRTSTSELFLAEVQPMYAVISASDDNQYGHPHVEVTDALFNAGVTTYSTAEEGTVIFVSDGTTTVVQ